MVRLKIILLLILPPLVGGNYMAIGMNIYYEEFGPVARVFYGFMNGSNYYWVLFAPVQAGKTRM